MIRDTMSYQAYANNIEKMNVLKNNIELKERLLKILQSFNINFDMIELDKKIQWIKEISEKTMLEALILKVAKRSVSKAETTNEGFEFNEVTGKAAINEAIIYRTTMETFNTISRRAEPRILCSDF